MDRAVDGVRAIDIVERKERKGIVAARQRRDLNYGDTISNYGDSALNSGLEP